MKTIKLKFEYHCFPIWIYDENGHFVDNNLPIELSGDKDIEAGLLRWDRGRFSVPPSKMGQGTVPCPIQKSIRKYGYSLSHAAASSTEICGED